MVLLFCKQNLGFAIPLAPAPRRRTRRQTCQTRSIVPHQSSAFYRQVLKFSHPYQNTIDSDSILENACVQQHDNENIFSSNSSETNSYSVEIITNSPRAKRLKISSFSNFQSFDSQNISQSSRFSAFLVSTDWEASVLRALAAPATDSSGKGTLKRALLLVRGDYVRQRDIRALLTSRVHPALLESILTILLPMHASFTTLAQLAAVGAVPMIGPDEDPTEPLVLLTELLSALSELSPQLGLVF